MKLLKKELFIFMDENMENTILVYNNSLNFNLKQTMNNIDDLLYNIQSLKQLQWDIDNIQKLKDKGQMQVNMASLAILRTFILDEDIVGKNLFCNIVRKYYPLNDKQIIKYEGCYGKDGWYYITNLNILKRKGEYFNIGMTRYRIDGDNSRVNQKDSNKASILLALFYDAVSLDEIPYFSKWSNYVAQYSCYIDFRKISDDFLRDYAPYLAENRFITWDWELIERMMNLKDSWGEDNCCRIMKALLDNLGFLVQMGGDDIDKVLMKLQDIAGTKYVMTEDEKRKTMEKFKAKGAALYSYLPLSKDFIIQHQDDLNWVVLQKNPHIQWDLELINLFLRKIRMTVNELEWNKALQGSRAMYVAIRDLLNDEVLADIEKLYDL